MNLIGYIRVSTSEQALHGVSIAEQRHRLTAFATARGDTLELVEDAGVSAKTPFAERPGGAQVVRQLRAKQAQGVVVVRLDRLFRNAAEALATTAEWDAAGIALHLLDLRLDTSNPVGRLLFTVLAAFGEYERNITRQRTREGMAQVRARGGSVGRAPYGFIYKDGAVLGAVEVQMALIAKMCADRKKGKTLRHIAEQLNEDNIPTARGGIWHPSTVSNILKRAGVADE
jgi:site-specific DNA recombinase